MKIKRLTVCEYEAYRYMPVLNIYDGMKKNVLIKTRHDRDMFKKMAAVYLADPNHFGVKMRFINLHPELLDLYEWMMEKT